jgi:uncharacterized protein (DUF1501 family)
MLDSDIETSDALAQLSVPETGGFDRRRFLKMAAMTGGTAAFTAVPTSMLRGCAPAPGGAGDGILVVVLLGGGNDGLNTFVPYTDGAYYDTRGGLAVQPADVLDLDGAIGLNPKLPYLKTLWDQQKVAVVQGLGYDKPDLSHFSSMAKWMSGYPAGAPSSGWLGRWLDSLTTPADAFDAVSLGTNVPLHMVGTARRATGVRGTTDGYGTGSEPQDVRAAAAIESFAASPSGLGGFGDALAAAGSQMVTVNRKVSPLLTPALPEGDLVSDLTLAARLINANIGVRLVAATLGDFDTHAGQGYDHPLRLELLNGALESFYTTLDPAYAGRVTLMTFAEFGRRPPANNSGGTDHGTANSHIVIGDKVKAGMYGERPSLTNLVDDQLQYTLDFRSYFATVLEKWLGGDANAVFGSTFEQLDLFTGAPGA